MLFGKRPRTIKSILIVEDEPLVAFDNEHFLTDAGYQVVGTVDSVEDALRALDGDPIDLILADIMLADGSGLDVARAARTRSIPLMFVTGRCPVEARELAMACLSKPYSQRDLLAAINAVDAKIAGRSIRKPPSGFSLFN